MLKNSVLGKYFTFGKRQRARTRFLISENAFLSNPQLRFMQSRILDRGRFWINRYIVGIQSMSIFRHPDFYFRSTFAAMWPFTIPNVQFPVLYGTERFQEKIIKQPHHPKAALLQYSATELGTEFKIVYRRSQHFGSLGQDFEFLIKIQILDKNFHF